MVSSLTASLPTLLLALLGLIVLWLLISWLLRLAGKIISCGCVTLFILALILVAAHFLAR